jgi:hypothetical protein
VIRFLCALLLAAGAVAGSVGPVGAQPAGWESCAFKPEFEAFARAAGPDIVGVCDPTPTFEAVGETRQRTSTGVFYWDAEDH